MGPRPEDRGKLDLDARRVQNTLRLQWGHDPKIVENAISLDDGKVCYDLQWGHDPKIVENGLVLDERGAPWSLQWGHDPKIVENFQEGVGKCC